MARRERKLLLAVVIAEHMNVAALLQTGKARRADIGFGKVSYPQVSHEGTTNRFERISSGGFCIRACLMGRCKS